MSNWGLPKLHLRKKKTNVRRTGYLLLFLFAQPTWTTLVVGTGIVLVAVLVHGWAAGYLARAGYGSRETVLTVRGPYRHNRNPYYLSHMIMDLGFFMAAGFWYLYPLYFPFIFLIYSIWVHDEEQFLEQEFGEAYESMAQEVPRWGIRLMPAPSRGDEETFTWEDYFINSELKRTLCHLILIGLLWDFYYLANPFVMMRISTRMSLGSSYLLWILYRNVSRVEDGESRVGILLTGVSASLVCLMTVLVLMRVNVPAIPSWLRIIGIIIFLFPVGYQIDPFYKRFQDFYEDHFRNPMTYFFDLFIGVSLISGSILFYWWAITLALLIWAVNLEHPEISIGGLIQPAPST